MQECYFNTILKKLFLNLENQGMRNTNKNKKVKYINFNMLNIRIKSYK